jgi:hypothetical protein
MDAHVGLRHLVPSTSTWIDVPRSRVTRERTADAMRRLPPGAPVVLADRGFGARRRSRAFARLASVDVDRELLAIPSVDAPDYVIDDDRAALTGFWRGFVTVPPGTTVTAPVVTAGIRVVDALHAWPLVALVVPGRYTVGTVGTGGTAGRIAG